MHKRLIFILPLLGMLLSGCAGGIDAVTGISIDVNELSIMETESKQITATIEPKKATNQIIKWESANPNIATVSTGGIVTGVTKGNTTVKVTTDDGGYTATCDVTVTPYVPVVTHVTSIVLSEQSLTLEPDQDKVITYTVFPEDATNKGVTITSQNEDVAIIEDLGNNQFNVKAVNEGQTAIFVTSCDTPEEGKTPVVGSLALNVYKQDDPSVVHVTGINVSSPSVSMLPNEDVQVTYEVKPDNATNKEVTVSNSDNEVATIVHDKANHKISIHSLKLGNSDIVITANDRPHGQVISRKISVGVHDVIPVTGVNISSKAEQMSVGDSVTLTGTVTPNDATNKNVTWSSDNPAVASVNNGVVSALTVGTAKITITTEDGGFTDTCVVTVTERVRGYVYFTNNKYWSNVKVHYWSDTENLTVPMDAQYVNTQQETVYRAEIVIADSYQFTDGADQWTVELTSFEENAGYYVMDEKEGNNYKVGKWSVVPYNIVYNANGGTGTMNTRVAYNSADNGGWGLDKNQFVKDGFAFAGWATSSSGDVVYKDGAIVPNDTVTKAGQTLNLYAKWIVPEQGYKVKVGSSFYDLTLNDGSEYVSVSDVAVHSGEIVECYKGDQKLTNYSAKATGNNNCWNDNGTVKICLDITDKIYVNISDKDAEKTIFCGGLKINEFYLSVNNKPSLLTKNTQSEGNEYMLLGYTFNNNDLIKCVDTNSSNSNAVVFAIKKVDSHSISGFDPVNDGIKYSGSSVTADVYVKFIMGDDQIYFGPSNA